MSRVDRECAHVRGDPGGRGRVARSCSRTWRARPACAQLPAVSRRRSRSRICGRGRTWARCSCAATPSRCSWPRWCRSRHRSRTRRWAAGRAVYRTDLIVRQDAPYRTLEDTFGGRAGWTVAHSQSGFNAFRHHLLGYRTPAPPGALRARCSGNLVTARNVLDGVRDGRIDVGPAGCLLAPADRPPRTGAHRGRARAGLHPIDADAGFVAAAGAPPHGGAAARCVRRSRQPAVVRRRSPRCCCWRALPPASAARYALLLDWDREARAAGYELPA